LIGDVLVFLRKHSSAVLSGELAASGDEPGADKVVFVDGEKADLAFPLGAVSELLINVEEERVLRAPDRYARQAENGSHERVQPDIRLVLYVLFVARFKAYETAWEHLSKLIEHFQSVPVFEPQTTPELPAGIEKLGLELVTLRFAEQNEVWSALRATYLPSILYRVKLIALRDSKPQTQSKIDETIIRLQGIS
jgi:hypothetical protein